MSFFYNSFKTMDQNTTPENSVRRETSLLRARLDEAQSALSGLTQRIERFRRGAGGDPGTARRETAPLHPAFPGRRSGAASRRTITDRAGELEAMFHLQPKFREVDDFREFVGQALDLETRLREAELRIETTEAESRKLSAQVAQLEQALQEAQKRGDAEAAKALGLGARADDLEAKLKEAQQRGDDEAAKIRELEARSDDLEAKLKEAQQRGDAEAAKALGLEARSDDLDAKLHEAQRRGDDEAAKARGLEARAGELQARSAELQARSDDLDARLHEAQRRGEDEAARAQKLEAQSADLQAKLRQAEESAEAEGRQLAANAADLEAQLKTAHSAAQTQRARAAEMDARRRKAMEGAEAGARQLAAKAADLEAQLKTARAATQALQPAEVEAKLRQAEERAKAGTSELEAKLRQAEERAKAEAAELEAKLRQAEERAKAEAAKSQELAAKAEAQPPATVDAYPEVRPEGTASAPPIPALEPALGPGWSRALGYLRQPLAAAYARLRKLSATSLGDDQRAQLKAAAAALAQGTDALTLLGEFWEEAAPAPTPGRLDMAVAAAVAVWEPSLRQRGISLVRRQDAQLPPALFHPEGLRLALYQVLRNAYESMPRAGSLTVRLFKDEASGGACVSICDTGTGFSREVLAKLPALFASTKPGHLGIGLSLTRRILDRWGANLVAVNNDQIGATVTLRFALGQEEPPSMQGRLLLT
jgi:hypothetical protein